MRGVRARPPSSVVASRRAVCAERYGRGTVVDQAAIQKAAEVLATHASSPARVILFGSAGRDQVGPYSDLDFLVIEDELDDTIREAARLRRALPALGVSVDVLAISATEAERRRHWPGNVIKVALAEGKLLAES